MKFFDFMSIVGKKFEAGELKESENVNENDISVFNFSPSGTVYAANPQKKKTARATISLPLNICGESVSDIFEWDIKIIAVKKRIVSDIIDEFTEEGEKQKQEK